MDDMTQGYLDGYADDRDEYPETLANRSDVYRHGWLNGRDDRRGNARAPASTLRDQAAALRAIAGEDQP